MTTLHHIVQRHKIDVSRINETNAFEEFAFDNTSTVDDTEIYLKTKFRNLEIRFIIMRLIAIPS